MKILLINNNPVVSRLTALSARKENIELDEIKNISELKASDYNIIFVDGESFNNDVSNIIRNSGVNRRVLFYTQGEEENSSIFTQAILKPFLPSEVSEILRDAKVAILESKTTKKKSIDFTNLVEQNREKELEALNIIEKKESTNKEKLVIASVATVDDTVLPNDNHPTNSSTERRVDAEEIKIEKLEIKKDNFDEKLEKEFPIKIEKVADIEVVKVNNKEIFHLDDDLFDLNGLKDTKLLDSDLELDKKKNIFNNKIDNDLFEIDKEIKKEILSDAPLDFDIESKKEVSFEPQIEKISEPKPKIPEIKEELTILKEPKVTPIQELESDIKVEVEPKIITKVLNNSEIANIKDILDEKEGAENLTEIPASLMSIEKKSDEKEPSSDKLSTGEAIAHTLDKLPVEDLRKLLRGAKINISIEFPNEV